MSLFYRLYRKSRGMLSCCFVMIRIIIIMIKIDILVGMVIEKIVDYVFEIVFLSGRDTG